MVGGYTEDLKNHKTVKIGGWALVQGWALARDNMVYGIIGNHILHAILDMFLVQLLLKYVHRSTDDNMQCTPLLRIRWLAESL